jgi:uncharacterized membrane protein YqjE
VRLLALFGLEARVRRVRAALGEGALAAEDRVQLVRMAWDDEKQRLRQVLLLIIAVIGLSTVAVALLSVAVVVHFWDTPQRIAAAWSVAAVWIALWLVALVALVSTLRNASASFEPTRREFERDWDWLHSRFSSEPSGDKAPREPRPATREGLLRRIELQRERVAELQARADARSGGVAANAAPPDESAAAAVVRLAREHPVATGVAVATALVVIRPRRLLRWAVFLAPVLWRMR